MIEKTTEAKCDRCSKTKVFRDVSDEQVAGFLSSDGWMRVAFKWYGSESTVSDYLLCNTCAVQVNEDTSGKHWTPAYMGITDSSTIQQVDSDPPSVD